jgi:hypothetical protein
MAGDNGKSKRTERTKAGLEVPVPKRGEFFSNLKKIAKVGKDSATRSPKQ